MTFSEKLALGLHDMTSHAIVGFVREHCRTLAKLGVRYPQDNREWIFVSVVVAS